MQTTEALSTRRMTAKAISVAWPAVMESFFVTLAGMIDTMMVSTLGPASVSAVGLTVQPKFIGLTLFFGINVAVSALVARRKGEQNREKANEILLTAGALSMVLTVLVSILFTAFAPQLMQISGSNAETHELAVEYFQIIMAGTVFNVITMVINAAQRGTPAASSTSSLTICSFRATWASPAGASGARRLPPCWAPWCPPAWPSSPSSGMKAMSASR